MLNNKKNIINTDYLIKFISILIFFIMINFSFGLFRYYIVVPLLSLLWLLFFITGKPKIYKPLFNKFIIISFLIPILAIPSLLEIFPHKDNINYSFNSYFFGIFFKVLCVYSVVNCLIGIKNGLGDVISKVLVINVAFFFIQLTVVYGTSYYIDPLEILIGEKQKYLSNFSLPVIGTIYRPTGFYEEPSTYSSIILLLLACKIYLEPKIDSIIKLSCASIILSLSVASMIYGAILVVYFLFRSKGTYIKYAFFLMLPFLIFLLIMLAESRLSSIGDASSIRTNLLLHVFTQFPSEIFFGNGMMGVITSLAENMEKGNLWSAQVAALNDNGLWLFLIIKIGVVGLLVVSIVFFIKMNNNVNRVLFFLILLTKVSMFYFIFILYTVIFLFVKERDLND